MKTRKGYKNPPIEDSSLILKRKSKVVVDTLNNENKNYRELVDLLPGIVFELDHSGNIVFINNAALEMLGYEREELLGRRLSDFILESERDRAGISIRKIIEGGRGAGAYYNFISKDGAALPFQIYFGKKYTGNNFAGLRGIAVKLNDIIKAEYALADNEELFRIIAEQTVAGISIIQDNKIVFLNKYFASIAGYTVEEVLQLDNRNLISKIYDDDKEKIFQFLLNHKNDKEEALLNFQFRILNVNGGIKWIDLWSKSVMFQGKKSIFSIGIDITQRKEAEKALCDSEEKFRTMIENSIEVIGIFDINGILQYCSQSLLRMLGHLPEELIGTYVFDVVHPDDKDRLIDVFSDAIKGLVQKSYMEFRCAHKDGSWRVLAATASNLLCNPVIEGIVINIRDITDRKNAEQDLRKSEEKFRTMIEHSSEVITILDSKGVIKFVSQSISHIFGFYPDEIIGINAFEYIHQDDRNNIFTGFAHGLNSKEKYIIIKGRLRNKNGSWRNVEATVTNMLDNPAINGIVVNIRDITDRKIAEEKAIYYEFHDSLTNLPNRDMFLIRLEGEITKAQSSRRKTEKDDYIFAVMSLGLDKLKNINDMYGPAIGDILLQKVGIKLQKSFREDDFVSRYAGDTFMIIFTDINRNEDVVSIIQKSFNVFADPFIIGSNVIKVTASIGVSLYPHDGHTNEILVKNSESAMYMAKEQGRNSYRLYDALMNTEMLIRLQIEKDLERAIYHNHFKAYYQPKVDQNGNIVGMESLIRWKSPEKVELIKPDSFISIAEKSGMIIDIGNIILYEACSQNKKWQESGYLSLRVAVNISPLQFNQPNLIPNIKNVISQTGLNPQSLELEITESGIMVNEKESIKKLNELHDLGIKISIDDFGIGYSSLSKLKDYPIDTLKIDKVFVENLPNNAKSATITRTIIDLAHNLGFKVVAEGVETKEQLDFLIEYKCDIFQGYYFSEPLEVVEFERKLRGVFFK